MNPNITLKIALALLAIAVAFGTLAGILVIALDLPLLERYGWIIIVLIGVVDIGLVLVAYKKGKIPIIK
jgi:uncharacterized membrane protein HdeD (DUF308 family)